MVTAVPKRIVLLVLGTAALFGASSVDSAADGTDALDQGYRQMYNLEFDQAHRTFHEFERLHPADALGPASDAAAYLFSELDRLDILNSEFFTNNTGFLSLHKPAADAAAKSAFENALARARTLAAPTPANAAAAPAAVSARNMFAQVLCSGLRSNYLSLIEKRNLAALGELKDGRMMAERLLSLDPTN